MGASAGPPEAGTKENQSGCAPRHASLIMKSGACLISAVSRHPPPRRCKTSINSNWGFDILRDVFGEYKIWLPLKLPGKTRVITGSPTNGQIKQSGGSLAATVSDGAPLIPVSHSRRERSPIFPIDGRGAPDGEAPRGSIARERDRQTHARTPSPHGRGESCPVCAVIYKPREKGSGRLECYGPRGK
jgi:hypothetical protein